jgi:hypothetical protein
MQFGKALERLLEQIVNANPKFGPVQLIQVDIADGFYRVWLNCPNIPKLAVAIPTLEGTEPLLALPLVLPMGWTQSPPLFCAATETATDMANLRLKRNWQPGPHRLDRLADTRPAPKPLAPISPSSTTLPLPEHPPIRNWKRKALAQFDVFVDDFIGLGQGDPARLLEIRQVLLHTIDKLFRSLDAQDSEYRNEPSSTKKLGKGDAAWATRKVVLGWVIDTIAMTIELPPHRQERLSEILADIQPGQKRTSVRKWQMVLGELRSMAIAIPGTRGIFSLMQEALQSANDQHRIRLSRGGHDCLDDFRWMSDDIQRRPTRLFELVPQPKPDLLGGMAPPAYLLRAQSIHQRFHRYHSTESYIPGPSNVMADDASRLLQLTPSQLLAHFNLKYPQTNSWRFVSPRTGMLSSAASALYRTRPEMASLLQAPPPLALIGDSGNVSASTSVSVRNLTKCKTPSSCYRSLRSVTAGAPSLPAVSASNLGQWKAPSVPWARRWPAWGPQTRVSPRQASTISGSIANFGATPNRTTLPRE